MDLPTPARERAVLGRLPARQGALLGAALVLGWLLHDVLVFGTLVHPRDLLGLWSGSLAALVLGALAGAGVARWPRTLFLALAATLVVSVAPLVVKLPLARAALWLPRSVFLLLVGWGVLARVHRRLPHGLVALGIATGLALCVAKGLLRREDRYLLYGSYVALAAAAAVCVVGFARARRWRALCFAAIVLVVAFDVVRHMRTTTRLRRADLAPATAVAEAGEPNLLLIVLDTVRADHLAPYGYGRVTTPGLDAFVAEHATLWTDARSTGAWTLPSHASLFTGLYPGEHGATTPRTGGDSATVDLPDWPGQPLREDVTTLAETLRDAGYQTAAILANCFYLRHEFQLDQGFERYDDRRAGAVGHYLALAQMGTRGLHLGHSGHRSATHITDLALDWLDEERRGAPFMLVLNYFDAHFPYLPPPPFERAFGGGRPRDPLSPSREIETLLYDRELLYLDAEVTRLLRGLEQRGLFEDTAIVVTADHGEAFAEHAIYRHGWGLYEELIRVPLYVKPAGGREVERRTELIDSAGVHDLMLQLVGRHGTARPVSPITAEWYYGGGTRTQMVERMERTFGRELQHDLVAWMEGSRKTIVTSTGNVEAYDLAQDRRERAPLPLTASEIEGAVARAQAWWLAHPPPAPVAAPPVDEQLLEELRGVGYAGE